MTTGEQLAHSMESTAALLLVEAERDSGKREEMRALAALLQVNAVTFAEDPVVTRFS